MYISSIKFMLSWGEPESLMTWGPVFEYESMEHSADAVPNELIGKFDTVCLILTSRLLYVTLPSNYPECLIKPDPTYAAVWPVAVFFGISLLSWLLNSYHDFVYLKYFLLFSVKTDFQNSFCWHNGCVFLHMATWNVILGRSECCPFLSMTAEIKASFRLSSVEINIHVITRCFQ